VLDEVHGLYNIELVNCIWMCGSGSGLFWVISWCRIWGCTVWSIPSKSR